VLQEQEDVRELVAKPGTAQPLLESKSFAIFDDPQLADPEVAALCPLSSVL
jgi:hypothetical protein